MSSAASSISQALEAYVAGRLKAERLVAAVVEAYYGKEGRGKGQLLRPLVEIIERAHPGVIELAASAERPGFAVRLAERPFPAEYEAQLRQAAAAAVAGTGEEGRGRGEEVADATPAPRGGWLARLARAVRRLFSASA